MNKKNTYIVHRLRYKILVTTLVFLAFIGPASTRCLADEVVHNTLPVGEKAPLFKSVTIQGQPFDLEQVLSNKNVVLFFWSFFCGPCREEMPLIQKFYQDCKDESLEIAGVNLDETTLHTPIKNYLKSSGFTYPTVVNKYEKQDAKIDKLYLVTGTPVVYMIRKGGTISFAHVGRIEFEDFKKAIQENLTAPDM